MKKIVLMLVFVLGTMTIMNANTSIINEPSVDALEINAPGMTCDEWSEFAFNWYLNILGYSFQDAAAEADRVYEECIENQGNEQ